MTCLAGWILIDRCGKHFGTILNYLRDGAVPLPEIRREVEELLAEAKYYLVQELADECHAALQVWFNSFTCTICGNTCTTVIIFSRLDYSQCWFGHDIDTVSSGLFVLFSLCDQNKDSYEPFCKVPLVTSSKEEQRLIATSNKVKGIAHLYHEINVEYCYIVLHSILFLSQLIEHIVAHS